MDIKCIFEEPAILGECPLWQPTEQMLYWVDIVKKSLHRLDPKTGQHQRWSFDSEIACIGRLSDGGLIAALRTSIVFIDMPSGLVKVVSEPLGQQQKVMFNDGHCDQQGRFWVGTKHLEECEPKASLYCFNSKGKFREMDKGFTVVNGIVFSPDSQFMYVCDSPKRVIYRYDYQLETGYIKNKIIFAEIPMDAGYPDGLTVDSKGYIWNAHWDGFRITRYSPTGKIDRVIEMPVQKPTSCCFGGPQLSTLYITSASRDLTEEELQKNSKSGCVFSIETDVEGLIEPTFKKEEFLS